MLSIFVKGGRLFEGGNYSRDGNYSKKYTTVKTRIKEHPFVFVIFYF